jgi:predicted phage baseplate assembly protein
MWLNGVWADHRAVADRELLGRSDGNGGQTFQTRQTPLLDAERLEVEEWHGRGESWHIWFDGLPESALRLERDAATGEVVAVWVLWTSQPHLYRSRGGERHYTVERATGAVRFGDGLNGMIPPAGRRIVISYTSGGGVRGNVASGAVGQLRTATPYVKGVVNPIAASGGADVEGIEVVPVRGAQHLRNRDRAVAALDIEWLAREASPAVARARCLSVTGPAGHGQRGWVTVVVVPFGAEPEPRASAQLRRDVQRHLAERVPASVASTIRIADARFVRIGVRADVSPVDPADSAALEGALRRALNAFLHPVTGGGDGRGWSFGESLHVSRIAALIEGIEGVDYASALSLVSEGALQGDEVTVGPDALLTFGDHEIRLVVGVR